MAVLLRGNKVAQQGIDGSEQVFWWALKSGMVPQRRCQDLFGHMRSAQEGQAAG